MDSKARFPIALSAAVVVVLLWSGIQPLEQLTWLLEVLPALAGLAVLSFTWRRFPFTPLLYSLMAAHMVLLAVGGHYTYAEVPMGAWFAEWLHLSRNHYDRLGHFAQGLVPAMIAREILIRLRVVSSPAWRNVFVLSLCLAISAAYELFEWSTAIVLGQQSDSFLGTQGDPWDTQADMFCALIGAVFAIVFLARWHDAQLRRLAV